MVAEVSPALERQLERADSQHQEAVLITLAEDADPDDVRAAGVDTTFVTHDGKIVAGRMTADALARTRHLDGVLRIEPDTQMHALGGE